MTFEQLVESLFKRGVIVTVEGRYNPRQRNMHYSATVSSDNYESRHDDFHKFSFTVLGRELAELVDDINQRLVLVEPMISFAEKNRQRRDAIRTADNLADEMATIRNGGVRTKKPNPLME